MRRRGMLVLAEGIRDAEHAVVKPVQVIVEVQVVLDGQLVSPIGAHRVGRVFLGHGHRLGQPVHRTA
jgi:hypothetical protein